MLPREGEMKHSSLVGICNLDRFWSGSRTQSSRLQVGCDVVENPTFPDVAASKLKLVNG